MAALDVGAWEIPSMMPEMLHPGEMVLPAGFASAQAWIGSILPQLARGLQSYQIANPSLV